MLHNKTRSINKKLWGVPYYAIDPSGVEHRIDPVDGTDLKTIQVVYNTSGYDSKTGEETYVYEPNITIAISDLVPFPKAGETWVFYVPESPLPEAPLKPYQMHRERLIREDALGTCRIFLKAVKQK
jgi:hypothetical protein